MSGEGVKGKAGFSFILSCVRTRLCQPIAQYPIWPLQGAHLCSPARSVHACLFYFFTQVKAHAVRLHYSSSAAAFSQRPSLSTHTHTRTLHEALHYIRISARSFPSALTAAQFSRHLRRHGTGTLLRLCLPGCDGCAARLPASHGLLPHFLLFCSRPPQSLSQEQLVERSAAEDRQVDNNNDENDDMGWQVDGPKRSGFLCRNWRGTCSSKISLLFLCCCVFLHKCCSCV